MAIEHIRLSQQARDQLITLKRRTGIAHWNVLCRWALCRSLAEPAPPPAVRLVLYPGEGHGNARAASRLDYHLRMLQWFDHYLKGPGGEPPGMEVEYKKMGVAADAAK